MMFDRKILGNLFKTLSSPLIGSITGCKGLKGWLCLVGLEIKKLKMTNSTALNFPKLPNPNNFRTR